MPSHPPNPRRASNGTRASIPATSAPNTVPAAIELISEEWTKKQKDFEGLVEAKKKSDADLESANVALDREKKAHEETKKQVTDLATSKKKLKKKYRDLHTQLDKTKEAFESFKAAVKRRYEDDVVIKEMLDNQANA